MKYKNKYLSLKNKRNTILQSGGIKCDNTRVYKNVLGTCWMVAIQTMFSFGDTTSGLLEKNIKEIRNLSSLIENAKLIPGVEKILPGIFDHSRVNYLMNILVKFKERYISKVYGIRNANDTHLRFNWDEQLKNKDRCELVIVQNYQDLVKDMYFLNNRNKYDGNTIDPYLFSNIISIFLLGCKTSFTNYYNCELSDIKYDSNFIGISIIIKGHACCFFVCNGVEKYYNDNVWEIIDCPWKEMLKKTNRNKCLYVQKKGCILLLTNEEYKIREDKSVLFKIESLSVLSKTVEPNSYDDDMQNLVIKNFDNIKDERLLSDVGSIYYIEPTVKNIVKSIKYLTMGLNRETCMHNRS